MRWISSRRNTALAYFMFFRKRLQGTHGNIEQQQKADGLISPCPFQAYAAPDFSLVAPEYEALSAGASYLLPREWLRSPAFRDTFVEFSEVRRPGFDKRLRVHCFATDRQDIEPVTLDCSSVRSNDAWP